MKKQLSVWVEQDQWEDLNRYATLQRSSISTLVRNSLDTLLDQAHDVSQAKCKFCGEIFAEVKGCKTKEEHPYFFDGKKYNYLPFHKDEDFQTCPDCGVEDGRVHHNGCDFERCPVCKEQFISCKHGRK